MSMTAASMTPPAARSRGRAAPLRLVLLLAAAALASCQGVAIGPVSHGCPGNPARASDSGCLDSHND